jgi:hypothetical protein
MINIEEQEDSNTIVGVTKYILQHPIESVIYRWNWKAGLLSGVLRSPIFLAAYLGNKEGLKVAFFAMLAQFVFRTLFGGVNGSLIQAYSRVEPAWQAILTVPIVLASFSHLIEFIVQTVYDYYSGATSSGKAITVSILISALSAVFNIFAMRRGALLVRDKKSQSLWKDIKSFPLISAQFIFFVPWKVWELIQRGRYIVSIFCTLLTSAGLGLAAWLLRGKPMWGIVTGISVLVLIIISVAFIAIYSARKLSSLDV